MVQVTVQKEAVNATFRFKHGGGSVDNFREPVTRDICSGEFEVCGLTNYIMPVAEACGSCPSPHGPNEGCVWELDNPWQDCSIDPATLQIQKGNDLWLELTDPGQPWSDGSAAPVNGYKVLVTTPTATSKYLGSVCDWDVYTDTNAIRFRTRTGPVSGVTVATPPLTP